MLPKWSSDFHEVIAVICRKNISELSLLQLLWSCFLVLPLILSNTEDSSASIYIGWLVVYIASALSAGVNLTWGLVAFQQIRVVQSCAVAFYISFA